MTELMTEDAEIRSAAFAHARRLQALNDHINLGLVNKYDDVLSGTG